MPGSSTPSSPPPPPATPSTPAPGPMPEQMGAPSSANVPPLMSGGAGAWMAHVKKTMRANKGKKLKDVLKLAAKTYKKTAKKTRKSSRKSKSWFMGGSSAIVASPASGPGSLTGGRSRRRKH